MTAHDVQTAATERQIGAAPEPAHGVEIVVPLNRLKASPRNARKVKHKAAAIEALAASIRAKGVLQAPVVEIERGREGAATGNYLVTIGEGRRQALRMLVKRKAIKRTARPLGRAVFSLREGGPGQGQRRRSWRFTLDLACRRLHIGWAQRRALDQSGPVVSPGNCGLPTARSGP